MPTLSSMAEVVGALISSRPGSWFAIGQAIIMSGAAAALSESLPSFAAGTLLWATALLLVSVPK